MQGWCRGHIVYVQHRLTVPLGRLLLRSSETNTGSPSALMTFDCIMMRQNREVLRLVIERNQEPIIDEL